MKTRRTEQGVLEVLIKWKKLPEFENSWELVEKMRQEFPEFLLEAKTVVVVRALSFLGAFSPYYTINNEGVSLILKILVSLLSPTAFALGPINFVDYELTQVELRWRNIWWESSGVDFSVCLLMMVLDTLLFCAIGPHCDKVLPKEYGLQYPWIFIFKTKRKGLLKKEKVVNNCSFGFKVKNAGISSEPERNLLG
ncbi:ATP-binding cassette sub- A member 1 [Lathyrus oleraceus]|uniref:ATP-binding cassette sub- A member 1 n=1 Tax=Pisum sativum TaxID=3888 RepID=A0A9D4XTL8_PEA|nr:ATP-binding cassette sub- A member 1 [Pisum sativum]